MNVYLRDIRLYLEYIDPIEATIRLSQTMKRPRIIVRVEEGGVSLNEGFLNEGILSAHTPSVSNSTVF